MWCERGCGLAKRQDLVVVGEPVAELDDLAHAPEVLSKVELPGERLSREVVDRRGTRVQARIRNLVEMLVDQPIDSAHVLAHCVRTHLLVIADDYNPRSKEKCEQCGH